MNAVRRRGLWELLIAAAAMAAMVTWYYLRFDVGRAPVPRHLNAFMVPLFNAFLFFGVQGAVELWTGRPFARPVSSARPSRRQPPRL